jgi:hypothetical protein
MKTNLYGNRKALNTLNATLLAENGKYIFSKPLVASKTVEGHFRIEFVITERPVLGNFGESLSTPFTPTNSIERVNIEEEEVVSTGKITEGIGEPLFEKEYKDPWWVTLIRKIF